MSTNPLKQLQSLDQSFWYDGLSRSMIDSGTLQRLVDEDGLRGITSNPTIFANAIAERDAAYADIIQRETRYGKLPEEVFDEIAKRDIRDACEALASVHASTNGRDGFVSLEEPPSLAYEVEEAVREGQRLHRLVDRPNLLVKVPATPEGITAFHELIAEGWPINVTLIFSPAQYRAVAEAYIDALEARRTRGLSVDVPSVASIFVSRIDAKIDAWIDQLSESMDSPPDEGAPDLARRDQLLWLRGRAGIANAKACYAAYRELFHSDRFGRLERDGARPQRLLLASTQPKDPAYPDTMYVDSLIGPETVVTMPPATVDAFRDHGTVEQTLDQDMAEAAGVLARLDELGIDLSRAMSELLDEGVRKFADSFDELIDMIARERHAAQRS